MRLSISNSIRHADQENHRLFFHVDSRIPNQDLLVSWDSNNLRTHQVLENLVTVIMKESATSYVVTWRERVAGGSVDGRSNR